jgi:hypothetical protein
MAIHSLRMSIWFACRLKLPLCGRSVLTSDLIGLALSSRVPDAVLCLNYDPVINEHDFHEQQARERSNGLCHADGTVSLHDGVPGGSETFDSHAPSRNNLVISGSFVQLALSIFLPPRRKFNSHMVTFV